MRRRRCVPARSTCSRKPRTRVVFAESQWRLNWLSLSERKLLVAERPHRSADRPIERFIAAVAAQRTGR
jgi:hypothetical protein